MVSINYATREVICKIVYYGPGLSGKTTNLQYIHDKVPSDTRGKMISLATEADRTLYFDFLPINIGTISGFAAKFQLYTVPGQVYYNATRKLVLRGTDGLVFTADSQIDKMDDNIESLNNMGENLIEYGYDINDIPIVIQYNKRDLPNILSIAELEEKLNPYGWKSFEAEAVNGGGVFDTLKMIIKLVLDKARRKQPAKVQAVQSEATSEKPGVKAQISGGTVEKPPATLPTAELQTEVAPPPATESEQIRQPAYEAKTDEPSGGQDESVREESVQYSLQKEEEKAISPPVADKVSGEDKDEESPEERGPEITDESWGQQRPYPGSTTRISRRGRRITVSDFQPAAREENVSAFKSQMTESDKKDTFDKPSDLPTPSMAPSSRLVKKKRGFLRRLFGLK